MHFLIIGNPENRRVTAFVETVLSTKAATCSVVAYLDVLNRTVDWSEHALPNTIVRLESTGENTEVRRRLVEYAPDTPSVNRAFFDDFGRIGYSDAWYRGFSLFLHDLKRQLNALGIRHWMNDVTSILTQFDKTACKVKLSDNNVPQPRSLPPVCDYPTLRAYLQKHRLNRVFIKPAHSSSASGVVAFRTNGTQCQAITSVEMVLKDGDWTLYNRLKVQTYTDESQIELLIDHILQSQCVVEEWIPKASFRGATFDFRVVVIAGKARHTVARLSPSPITNLHLGNARGNLPDIIQHIGGAAFEKIQRTAEQAAACFPNSLYMGVDVLLSANFKHVKVLEINAFGDLLPNVMDAGETVYEAEIRAVKAFLTIKKTTTQ